MSSAAMRMGARRVAAAARKPAQQPRRTMSDGPKRVLENQKKFQENPHLHGADNPTYMKKGPADYAVNAVGGLLIFTGMAKFTSGLYHMSYGTNVMDIQ